MAVLHNQLEMTADAVSPVPTRRFAVMNISVVLLFSPAVFRKRYVTPIIIKAMKKPIATTTAYPAAWGRGGSMPPPESRETMADIASRIFLMLGVENMAIPPMLEHVDC